MAGRDNLSANERAQRADGHAQLGDTLCECDFEWAAVCYFYAAYHTVRASLHEDAVFDSLDSCQERHVDLRPEDRDSSSHSGRRIGKQRSSWGVNELVTLLYPGIAGTYDRLHSLSIDVRYGRGLACDMNTLSEVWQKFQRLINEGALSSAVSGG